MPRGLIDVGQDYKGKAMSGFVREAAANQRLSDDNRQMAVDKGLQNARNVTQGTGALISVAMLCATL